MGFCSQDMVGEEILRADILGPGQDVSANFTAEAAIVSTWCLAKAMLYSVTARGTLWLRPGAVFGFLETKLE